MTTPPESIERWQHSHIFSEGNPLAERNTKLAVWLTAGMMVVEIAGGIFFNSMALLADGWHMSTHALALGISVLAYMAARRWSHDRRFAFGTWKIEILGSYTSALFLVVVAAGMFYHSVERLLSPLPIRYEQAIAIAFAGLAVNLVCAWLLHGGKGGHHEHEHVHSHGHHAHGNSNHRHEDLNLRAAYVHVLTDAATSVLAIVALFGGMLWGADWLDPLMGIAGAAIVAVWAWGLLRDAGRILLDAEMDAPVVAEICEVIAQQPVPAHLVDLHLWRVASNKYACIVSVVSSSPTLTPDVLRQQLQVHEELAHVTVEVNMAGKPESD